MTNDKRAEIYRAQRAGRRGGWCAQLTARQARRLRQNGRIGK